MIQSQTMLKVVDNSGATKAKCIGILGGTKRRYAYVGDVIVVAIQTCVKRAPTARTYVKPGMVMRAVVLRTRHRISRRDGSCLKFFENSCALLSESKKKEPYGSSINGSVPREVRDNGFIKFGQIASEVV